ncbi:hypothetical protein IW139_004442, partial [Coemansia sp. RSA 353]
MSEAVPTLARIEIRCETANSEFAGIVQETCRSKLYAGSRLYDSKRWQAAVKRQVLGKAVETGQRISVSIGSRTVEFTVLDIHVADEPTDIPSPPTRAGRILAETCIVYIKDTTAKHELNVVPGYEAETAGLAREISGYFSSKHLYQHLRTEPPQTIYLCGVPGVGKSTVLQNALGRLPFPAVRGDLSEIVVSASGTEIADDYVSMSLKDLVDQARSATPSVLFVDNFDVLADSEQSESITDLASHIVKFIEGIPDGVVLVIESSVGDAELPVSIRRCNALQHRVTISVPRLWQRREIVRSVIDDMLKGSSDIETLVGQVANVTAGYVARDITALCRQAALRKLRHPPKAELATGADSLVQSMQQLSLAKDTKQILLPEWHDFEQSLQIVRPSQQLAFESARPSKRWTDIGGYEETKHRLQQFVQLAISEEPSKLGIKPPSGILLYGPSGCGKTAMAQAMIGESNCNVINIRGSELFSKYLGETEARLRQLFEAARAAAPCIVFMDEVDSIAAKREWASVESGGPALRVLSTLLNEMDGVHDTRGVVVIGCTNQLDKIDDAIARPGKL